MKYFTKLIERLGKAPRIKIIPPQAPEGPASTHRLEPVQGLAEQPPATTFLPQKLPANRPEAQR